jgi:hypothetical protein
VVRSQTLQSSVGYYLDVLRAAVGAKAAPASLRVDLKAELCSDSDLVANGLECLAHKLLVREWSIRFRRIEMSYTTFMRRAD